MADRGPAAVAGQQAHHRREVAPRRSPPSRPPAPRLPGRRRSPRPRPGPRSSRRRRRGTDDPARAGNPPTLRRHLRLTATRLQAQSARRRSPKTNPPPWKLTIQGPGAGAGPAGTVDPHGEIPARPLDGPVIHHRPRRHGPKMRLVMGLSGCDPGLQGEDAGLVERGDRALALHYPVPHPHPAVNRCHPHSIPASAGESPAVWETLTRADRECYSPRMHPAGGQVKHRAGAEMSSRLEVTCAV